MALGRDEDKNAGFTDDPVLSRHGVTLSIKKTKLITDVVRLRWVKR